METVKPSDVAISLQGLCLKQLVDARTSELCVEAVDHMEAYGLTSPPDDLLEVIKKYYTLTEAIEAVLQEEPSIKKQEGNKS